MPSRSSLLLVVSIALASSQVQSLYSQGLRADSRAGTGTAPAILREFRIDTGHSDVSFSIGFLGRAVKGRFDDVQGTFVYAPTADGNPGQSAITVAIETGSINTGWKHRDDHLRSSDFFDAQRFPTIVFQSRSIRRSPTGFVMSGPLTMHGVTRTIDIPFRPLTTKPVEDPHGSTLMSYSGSLRIARKDFGILGGSKYNEWFDQLRSSTMSDTVDVNIELEVWATDFARDRRYEGALKRIATEGIAARVAAARAAYAKNPKSFEEAEWEFSQIGAALLAQGKTSDAVELLKLNAEFFPKSPSARVGLARAYEVAGQSGAARKLLAEALAVDPFHTRALEMRRRLGP